MIFTERAQPEHAPIADTSAGNGPTATVGAWVRACGLDDDARTQPQHCVECLRNATHHRAIANKQSVFERNCPAEVLRLITAYQCSLSLHAGCALTHPPHPNKQATYNSARPNIHTHGPATY